MLHARASMLVDGEDVNSVRVSVNQHQDRDAAHCTVEDLSVWTEEDEGSLLRREVVRERLDKLTSRHVRVPFSLRRRHNERTGTWRSGSRMGVLERNRTVTIKPDPGSASCVVNRSLQSV